MTIILFLFGGNLPHTIQMQLSKKKKLFLIFFLNFWNLYQILSIWKKNEPNCLCISNYEKHG